MPTLSRSSQRDVPARGTRVVAWRRSTFLVIAASMALGFGGLVYLCDRPASSAPLMPTVDAFAGRHLFGVWGQWLPSFVHPFAFSLFTAAALPARSQHACGACAAWAAINLAFEIGQHPLVSVHLANALQSVLGEGPSAHALANYFVRGSFDVGDIAALLFGSLAASAVLAWLQSASRISDAS